MANDLVVQNKNNSLALFLDPNAMRIAEILAKSTLVPQHFKNNPGNCLIALNFAARSGADPLLIMQSMYIVHNKPALETKLLVALFNADGRFTPLEYIYSDDRQECRCCAVQKSSNQRLEGPVVSIDMAKKEGWYTKNNSKWPTMPETMLGYRAAAFFIRRFAPEVTFGMQTTDEIIDMTDNDSGTYEMVQKEIKENANQKMIDFEPEPEYVKPTVTDISAATTDQLRTIIQLEKQAGRDKNQTLRALSGFTGRTIEKTKMLTAEEAMAYIEVCNNEMQEMAAQEQQNDMPNWA